MHFIDDLVVARTRNREKKLEGLDVEAGREGDAT